ncbi:aminotransferase class V-fold PLP-dependent enzyme [Janthinobacterium sp.]|uniref:aminotransferase class V-fold PLP-dependent enzyme n=1 Tax=Janthinobacterium sp. TaxID=1871054 RepID=UPI00293D47EA|nr:aminotransferase class V-fold PLP-dependent enzyme [Janthinobacterium sp.]
MDDSHFPNPAAWPPSVTARAPDDEAFWAGVRAQYAVSTEFINLENGFFGVQAQPVFEAFLRHQRQVNTETSYFLRQRYAARHAAVLRALADFCGVGADELIITRNLVEAMNILIQGYPFRAGDEVLLATHDYDSVADTLEMVSRRKGIALRRVSVPLDPRSDAQIVDLYEQAIHAGTRVLLLTHMVHRTGQIMPVAKIAAMARRHGVDVMVDAAHSFAHLHYTLPQLEADFVAVNLHKWLGAPLGVGLLYIRKARVAEIAPLFGSPQRASQRDSEGEAGDIGKLAHFGTVPPAPILNVLDALQFHHWIGGANKEARLRYLKEYWLRRVRAMPLVEVLTPGDPQRSCAIAAFNIRGVPARDVVERLMAEHKIFTVARDIEGRAGVRVTPHLFSSLAELDLLVAAIAAIAAHPGAAPQPPQGPADEIYQSTPR